MVWDTPEEKTQKKLRKCTKNAAYAVGGGLGLWLLKAFYPEKEGAEKITELFTAFGGCLILYGVTVLAVILFKKDWALRINAVLSWIVIPSYVVYLLVNAWSR